VSLLWLVCGYINPERIDDDTRKPGEYIYVRMQVEQIDPVQHAKKAPPEVQWFYYATSETEDGPMIVDEAYKTYYIDGETHSIGDALGVTLRGGEVTFAFTDPARQILIDTVRGRMSSN
jgi:hypothetical protein